MSSSEDTSDYECADVNISKYKISKGNLSTKKRKYQLIDSVINNDVDTLKNLLTSSKWYKVTDKHGHNLLQIALIRNNKDVFDYLLSLSDFPLESRNKDGKTSLHLSMNAFINNDFDNNEVDEHFALELVRKGVCIPSMALHYAARRNFIEVAKLLLDKGFNPNLRNNYGSTPLHEALDSFSLGVEFEAALLNYGIDTLIEDGNEYTGFELALHHPGKSEFLETLCNYSLDDDSSIKIHLSVLLNLAQTKSPFFHKVVNQVVEVAIDQLAVLDYYMLFFIEQEFLRILVEKCGFLIVYVVMASNKIDQLIPFTISTNATLDNLNSVIEETLFCEMVDFVASLNSNALFGSLTQTKVEQSVIVELVCYLLSYGMSVNELDLQMVYEHYGYGPLFKFLLHMDFKMGVKNRYAFGISVIPIEKSIMPIFIYDININMHVYLRDPYKYAVKNVDHLLKYFRHPTLVNCLADVDNKVLAKAELSPELPLLVQLARDAFRKFLIEKYEITTASQFYSYVKYLPINNVYKKIITYEKKIY